MTKRPSDQSGRGFLKILRSLRKRNPPLEIAPTYVDPAWVPKVCDESTPEESLETAEVGSHVLMICAMKDAFLDQNASNMPKFSYCIYPRGSTDPVFGGQAPSLDEARARVERLWRALAKEQPSN